MDFLKNINEDSILLIPNNIKDKVLNYINNEKLLINIKIISFNDLLKGLFYGFTNEAIYEVMSTKGVTYETAKDFINNTYYLNGENENKEKIKYIKEIKEDLDNKNLLIKDPLFKSLLKSKSKMYVFGFTTINKLELHLLDLSSKYIDIETIQTEEKEYKNIAHNLGTLEDEVIYVAEEISKLIYNGVDINKIYISNYDDEYYFSIKKIFSLYNLPIHLKAQTKLSDTTMGKYFIHNLKDNIEELLDDISKKFNVENNQYNQKVFNKITTLVNSYYWANSLTEVKNAIEEEIKTINISSDTYEKEIKVCDITDNIFYDDEYVFLLGFNQKSIPRSFKDEDYLDDSIKTSLMEDTLTQNKTSRIRYSEAIKNIKNLTITFKETSLKSKFLPSTLIDGNLITLDNDTKNTYSSYSNKYNKLLFFERLDDLIKFNDYKKDIEDLNNNYSINYKGYDNQFTGLDSAKVKEKLSTKGYSYSSISTYYECPFRFYLDYFFRLNEFETTFSTFIGSAFHKVLEVCLKDDTQDIDTIYYNEIENNKDKLPYTEKEKFYTDKVNEELHFIVDAIKDQYTHSKHNPKNEIHEKYIEKTTDELGLNTNIKSIVKGIVDKCMFINNDVVIVDYKTGTSATLDRDHFEYGVTIQLPIYLYLLKNENKNYNIVGMYLQHILTGIKRTKYDTIKNRIKLDGLTLNDAAKVSNFDDTFDKSEVIKGLSYKDGELGSETRIITKDEEDKLYNTIKNLIERCINETSNAEFTISPIKDDKVDGCKFCSYKDICFKKADDIKYINNYTKEEGEIDG